VRNVTSDHFAGVAPDELEDPRPWAELLRQWSTFHPEFAALPRKFKIAVSATPGIDRAAVQFHDIGVRLIENETGERGFEILVGGGMGRTPLIGPVIGKFVRKEDLLSYVEAVLRVYNWFGRRDNLYKARIKILVHALGEDEFRARVEEEWAHIKDGPLKLAEAEIARVSKFFAPPAYASLPDGQAQLSTLRKGQDRELARFVANNVRPHKQPGYASVVVSLKQKGVPPGDMTDLQMDAFADLAERFGFGELRVTHTQNLVLPDVRISDVPALHAELVKLDLATPNFNRLTDIIACPGLDYCALANARSIPVALELMERFEDIDYQNDLGELNVKISGCINACGHHHAGNIGILGVDRKGSESYQLLLGGSGDEETTQAKIAGPGFDEAGIVDAVERAVEQYRTIRQPGERFIDTYRRVGMDGFKEAIYG
jgi:sulfite reductase (NADPH) hemoprotein beta-component